MKTYHYLRTIILGIALFHMQSWSHADDKAIDVLYLKNNSSVNGHIYVDGEYQGYVSSGEARYTVREGFVTPDSGFQPDGNLKLTYSHGGWRSNGKVTVSIKGTDSREKQYSAFVAVAGDDSHKAYVWWGDKEPGNEPEPLTWENSAQIRNANAPITPDIKEVFKFAVKAKGDSEIAIFFGISCIKAYYPSGDSNIELNERFFKRGDTYILPFQGQDQKLEITGIVRGDTITFRKSQGETYVARRIDSDNYELTISDENGQLLNGKHFQFDDCHFDYKSKIILKRLKKE